ncbi:hypothetical protein CCR85_03645 [Rhodothalassium salexigens]|nr:hypothetical protein [Rhodothalassium salexigens]
MIGPAFTLTWQLLVPVALMSYLLVGRLMHEGHLPDFETRKALKAHLKKARKAREGAGQTRNPLVRRWLRFGGGFYGIVAAYTFFVLEPPILFSLIVALFDADTWSIGGLISLVVTFLANSFAQVVTALLWFGYWLEDAPTWLFFAGLVAVYVAYAQGVHWARVHQAQGVGHVALWRWFEGPVSPARQSAACRNRAALSPGAGEPAPMPVHRGPGAIDPGDAGPTGPTGPADPA